MLSDLDELVMTCSDPRSRAYLRESVQCYKAGAYRSSVITCWIAVAFDLVDKIRELAAAGDKEAQAQIGIFEKNNRSNDISGALKFEKELPELALRKFEFISHSEHKDLERLVEDRNRCAHPSQVSDDQVFEASAELARLHISNSVKAILSQPAAQGKAALEKILSGMESKYFPSKQEAVYSFLQSGPLCKPRKSLYKNFLSVMVKTLLSAENKGLKNIRAKYALVAAKKMHPALWEEEFSAVLNSNMVKVKTDEDFACAVHLMSYPRAVKAWDQLSDPERTRICAFVYDAPAQFLEALDGLLDFGKDHELYKVASKRIAGASLAEIKEVGWTLFLPELVVRRVLELYSQSRNFADANDIGKYLRSNVLYIEDSKECVHEIVKIASKNDQVQYSNELIHVLRDYGDDSTCGLAYVKDLVDLYELEVQGL